MAIKAFVYTTKHKLEAATQQSFRHTHIYELLAATFGFNSSAALSAAPRPCFSEACVSTATGLPWNTP